MWVFIVLLFHPSAQPIPPRNETSNQSYLYVYQPTKTPKTYTLGGKRKNVSLVVAIHVPED